MSQKESRTKKRPFGSFQMGGSHWFTGADAIRDLELIANRTRNGFGPTITEPTSQAPFEFEPPGLDSISMINQDKRLRFGRGNSRHSFRTAVLLRTLWGERQEGMLIKRNIAPSPKRRSTCAVRDAVATEAASRVAVASSSVTGELPFAAIGSRRRHPEEACRFRR